MMTEDTGEWLTYVEAANRLGIKADSVRRRAAARRWKRRQGNDGLARVLIPLDAIPDAPPDVRGDVIPDSAPADPVLSAQLFIAEARLQDARSALTEMQEDRDRWRSQAEALANRKSLLDRLMARFSL